MTPQLSAAITFTPLQQQPRLVRREIHSATIILHVWPRTVVLRLFAFLSIAYASEAKIYNQKRAMTFIHSDAIPQPLHPTRRARSEILLLIQITFGRTVCFHGEINFPAKAFSNHSRCLQICMKMRISAKDGKRALACKISRGRRRGNALSYVGNICKQVIDALERRLDKCRTVPLLFKRPRTCEWIFCSQKARRAPQDFHSRPSRPLRALSPSITKAHTKRYATLGAVLI